MRQTKVLFWTLSAKSKVRLNHTTSFTQLEKTLYGKLLMNSIKIRFEVL